MKTTTTKQTLVSTIIISILALAGSTACRKDSKDEADDAEEATPVPMSGGAPSSDSPSTDYQTIEGYNFACAPDVEHSDDAPLFVRPFDPKHFNTGSSNNPKAAMGMAGGMFMTNADLGHIIPTVHNYNSLKAGVEIPIHAMAAGHVLRVARHIKNEYSIYIAHSCSVVAYFGHLSYLHHPGLIAAVAAVIPNWDKPDSIWEVHFGSSRESEAAVHHVAESFAVERGARVATKSSAVLNTALDVGVMDARRKSERIVNPAPQTYMPAFWVDATSGDAAVHFAEYLSRDDRELFASYLDVPADRKVPAISVDDVDFGTLGQDIAGTLNGIWFRNDVYGASDGMNRNYMEAAALVVTEEKKFAKGVRVLFATQAAGIGQGLDAVGMSLIKLDPAGWAACGCDESQNACVLSCQNAQKRLSDYVSPFSNNTDLRATYSSASGNLAPSLVDEDSAVTCYDFKTMNATVYNQMYFKMVGPNELRVKFVPSSSASPLCGTATGITMDANYFTYVRGADVL
jgi:hypothetical protein